MKIGRHGSAGGRRLSRRGRCSAPPAILSTSAQADNPFSPIRSISSLALRRWVRKCGRNGRFSPQGTDNSNACLLVWSDCRCNPNTWFLVRLIHLLSQHCTREFHGGMQHRTTWGLLLYIFRWQFFYSRNLLCLQNQSDEILCQICGPQMNSCNFHVFQPPAVS